MKSFKAGLAAIAVAGLMMAPVSASADPVTDGVETVGCGIVTIITFPIKILTGGEPGCQ